MGLGLGQGVVWLLCDCLGWWSSYSIYTPEWSLHKQNCLWISMVRFFFLIFFFPQKHFLQGISIFLIKYWSLSLCVYIYTSFFKSSFLLLDCLACEPTARTECYQSSVTPGGALSHFLLTIVPSWTPGSCREMTKVVWGQLRLQYCWSSWRAHLLGDTMQKDKGINHLSSPAKAGFGSWWWTDRKNVTSKVISVEVIFIPSYLLQVGGKGFWTNVGS